LKYNRRSNRKISIFSTILKTTVLVVLALSILFIPTAEIAGQSLEEELEQIKQEREDYQEKIDAVKKQESEYFNQVDAVEEELLASLDELHELNSDLSHAKSEVDKTTIELVLKEQELLLIEEELEEKVAILNDRVANMYKNNNGNILSILLKSEDFVQFISRLRLMNILAEQDALIIQEIKEKKNANLSIKKAIVDLRDVQKDSMATVERLVTQAEQKNAEIEDIYDEKKSLLSQTTANKNALIAMEKQLEIQEAEITRILESYKYGNAPGDKFMWPVVGTLRSGFGWRIHPIFGTNRFHSGIDLSAPYGTLIKAADGGEIVQAGYFGGYGYSIMVYHGGGFATWYAHLSSINCSVGQFVERGQVIGLVGSTGWSTGPHLHFEVRINGQAQNPLAHLQ